MKHTKHYLLAALAFFLFSFSTKAQSVDEIIDGYFETIGGKEKLESVTGMKMTAKVNQGGMEIPVELVQLKDGRQYTKFSLQGTEFMQGVYDGQTLWNINFQSMQAEKSDAEETENYKKDINDFMDPFLNYKQKGYTAELLGTETMEGTETYKIKLIREPKMLDGAEVEDITFYYFDTEAYIPLATESEIKQGPAAGQISQTKFSDYQEVDGIYFPFSLTQGLKDQPGQTIAIESIELNPEVDASVFAFPEGE